MWGANPTTTAEELQISSIAQVVEALQTVLTTMADQAGRASDFIVREVKLRGSTFVQILVFGFLADSHATLEALAQTAAVLGVHITPQALDQRFTDSIITSPATLAGQPAHTSVALIGNAHELAPWTRSCGVMSYASSR